MVYIGTRKYKFKNMMLSHMAADTLAELHKMAEQIGVDSRHFQDKEGKPHYDVCQHKKNLALKFPNVKEVDDRDIIRLYSDIQLANKSICKICDGKGWYFVDEFFMSIQGRKDCNFCDSKKQY